MELVNKPGSTSLHCRINKKRKPLRGLPLVGDEPSMFNHIGVLAGCAGMQSQPGKCAYVQNACRYMLYMYAAITTKYL